jgi:phytoene dehydrogenase-like protein
VRFGHRVERIETEEGRVRAVWANGQRFDADVVFSNAGIRGTVALAGEDELGADYTRWAESLEDSLAGIMVRYALDRHVIDDRVLFVMPDITGDEFSEAVADGEMLRLEPGFYVTVGSNFDPMLAPPGGQSVVCGTLYYPESHRQDEALEMLARTERRLERLYPDLADAVVHRELVTMAGIGEVSGRLVSGEAIGVAQTVDQCGASRPDFRTPVEGLYIVGADTGTRAIGTELAAGSGFAAAEYALAREGQGRLEEGSRLPLRSAA